MPQKRFPFQLKKEGKIIDEKCECTLQRERKYPSSPILQRTGELWTSIPLPVTAMDFLEAPFILVFDPSVLFMRAGKSYEVPIRLQEILNWKTKRHARFKV
jgi:hypothetical protein